MSRWEPPCFRQEFETGAWHYDGPKSDLCEYCENLKHDCGCGESKKDECPCYACEQKKIRPYLDAIRAGEDPWTVPGNTTFTDEPPF